MPGSGLTTFFCRGALDVLSSHFADLILQDQECFMSQKGWEELLQLVPNQSVVATLKREWEKDPERSSDAKWADLRRQWKAMRETSDHVSISRDHRPT
jgi:DNA primase small subunit